MPLAAGTRLGPYEISSLIGKGGMGEVYRARDTKLDRDVAIKVLPEEFAQDAERLARFEREAKLLASLNHPNIASIYGLEESDGVTALVLELVEGPTLAERIAEGPIPVDEALPIARQMAEALEAGHEIGVIHRDLKPANVKVKEDGTVKVLDYGLAKELEGETPHGADSELSQSPTLTRQGTQVGVILGTAAYMSPEQAKGKRVDKRTDIFSFGCVLYEMLTGNKTFDGETAGETLAAVIKTEPEWEALPTDLSPTIRKYLTRCLEKGPKRRVRDIGDVRLAMEGVFDTEAAREASTANSNKLGLRPPLVERRSLWLRQKVPVAVSSLVIVGALVVYLVWPGLLRLGNGPDVADGRQTVSGLPDVPSFDGRPAIAVLPFENLSPDPEQAFFADGLAEDLITRLGSWRAFPVIARNASFRHRGGNLDMMHVGDELGVRYLVTGSVRRAGDQIRVTAQLIEAASGEHVWAETYDRAINDVFSLQDEISSTIAASLVGDLTRAEGERAHRQETGNLEAWSLYQLGLHHSDRYTRDDSLEAARYFEQALALDPNFEAAIAQLAMTNWMALTGDGGVATADQIAAAFETARRALELDPRDPVAHAALGSIYLMVGDPQNAVDATRRAVELNPSMPVAWVWFGWAQVLAGNPEACIVATERAQRLDPHFPTIWIYDSLALAHWEAGNYEASLTAGRRLVATHPTYLTGHLYVAMSAVSLGRIDEARAAIAEGLRVRPDLSIELMQNYLAVSRPEIDQRRNAVLRTAGLD